MPQLTHLQSHILDTLHALCDLNELLIGTDFGYDSATTATVAQNAGVSTSSAGQALSALSKLGEAKHFTYENKRHYRPVVHSKVHVLSKNAQLVLETMTATQHGIDREMGPDWDTPLLYFDANTIAKDTAITKSQASHALGRLYAAGKISKYPPAYGTGKYCVRTRLYA